MTQSFVHEVVSGGKAAHSKTDDVVRVHLLGEGCQGDRSCINMARVQARSEADILQHGSSHCQVKPAQRCSLFRTC